MNELIGALRPLLQELAALDASQAASAAALLNQRDCTIEVQAALFALSTGGLCPREAGPHVRWGRVCKSSSETAGFSIDAVVMDGPAPGAHTHTTGEFDFCIPLEGSPRFDGRGSTWLVYPPHSRHIPTVAGGKMLILYFLPGGQIRFDQ